ncbi:MAG: alpha/beta hydrolase [Candidatus Electrothrix gigas]|jgi:pimeloyl-ACP methyl ester carboxylesterase
MQTPRIRNTFGRLLLTAVFTLLSLVAAQAADKTFVLVHGAFGDQSVWDGPDAEQGVAEQLRQRNYRVVTVTLPGMGRNYAQSSEAIDLEAHIQHVLDVLDLDNVTDATMVCHSYAGMVCAAVQDRAPANRINKMVFFDAVVPESGESFFSAIEMPSPSGPPWFSDLEAYYNTLGIPVPPNPWCFPPLRPEEDFRLTGVNAAWLGERQRCQPINTLDKPLTFAWNHDVKKYFVHAIDAVDNDEDHWFSYQAFLKFQTRAINMGWNMYSIPGSHYVLISDPAAVVQLLMLIDSIPYNSWPFN